MVVRILPTTQKQNENSIVEAWLPMPEGYIDTKQYAKSNLIHTPLINKLKCATTKIYPYINEVILCKLKKEENLPPHF